MRRALPSHACRRPAAPVQTGKLPPPRIARSSRPAAAASAGAAHPPLPGQHPGRQSGWPHTCNTECFVFFSPTSAVRMCQLLRRQSGWLHTCIIKLLLLPYRCSDNVPACSTCIDSKCACVRMRACGLLAQQQLPQTPMARSPACLCEPLPRTSPAPSQLSH